MGIHDSGSDLQGHGQCPMAFVPTGLAIRDTAHCACSDILTPHVGVVQFANDAGPTNLSQAQACLIAAGRGCGAVLGAVAARKLEDAEAFAAELGCKKAYGGSNAYADICADPEIDICYVGTVRRIDLLFAPRLVVARASQCRPCPDNLRNFASAYALTRALLAVLQQITSLHMEHALLALRAGALLFCCFSDLSLSGFFALNRALHTATESRNFGLPFTLAHSPLL